MCEEDCMDVKERSKGGMKTNVNVNMLALKPFTVLIGKKFESWE